MKKPIITKKSLLDKILRKKDSVDWETKEMHELERSINIYMKLLGKVEEHCKLKWSNFNNYNEGRVTVRFESKYEKDDGFLKLLIKDVADELVDDNTIGSWKVDTAKVPEFVKAGHQIGTDLAIEFYNSDVYEKLEDKGVKLLVYFVNKLFQRLGYKDDWFLWDELRPYSQIETEELDEELDNIIKSSINIRRYKKYLKDPSFLERALHLFMNCILFQSPIITYHWGMISQEAQFWILFNRAGNLRNITNG